MCQPSEDVIKVVTFNPLDVKVLDCLPLFISAVTWEEKVQKSKTAFYMESAGYSEVNPDLSAIWFKQILWLLIYEPIHLMA